MPTVRLNGRDYRLVVDPDGMVVVLVRITDCVLRQAPAAIAAKILASFILPVLSR